MHCKSRTKRRPAKRTYVIREVLYHQGAHQDNSIPALKWNMIFEWYWRLLLYLEKKLCHVFTTYWCSYFFCYYRIIGSFEFKNCPLINKGSLDFYWFWLSLLLPYNFSLTRSDTITKQGDNNSSRKFCGHSHTWKWY